ncbi:MAG TPA: Yip1 family protein [Candidatus Izemoplasmatales bacterium]|nr:Yip1 family protein [Candidatus Izemoplasmatales bacterium]
MKIKLKKIFNDYIRFPAYILFHPFDGFEEFKRYKKAKLSVAIVFVVLFAYFQIFSFTNLGFLINNNNPLDLNSLEEIFGVVLIIFLFSVGNWSITTLMEGKGTYKEIFMVTGYALFPLLIIGFPSVILSNFLTLDEMALYDLMMYIAYFFTGWMLFMGILNIHEYGLFKTILTFIATFVSIAVMIFVGLLFFDLIQQIIAFIASIIDEINLRY